MTDTLKSLPPETIGARVRTRRKQLGMTQKDLASLAGCTQQSIVQLEGGQITNPQRILEIADALSVSARYLKMLTDDPTPTITSARVRAELTEDLPADVLAQVWALIQRHKQP